MRRTLGRALVVVAAAGGLAVASPLAAQACGCGGFVADQQVSVQQETAVVQLGAGHEVVTMQFAEQTEATKAAWVMPVPARASMELGDQALFDQLGKLTAPEVREVDVDDGGDDTGAGATPPGKPGVTVTDHITVGPYEVAQLAGPDPKAVAKWLSDNGFRLSDRLSGGLRPYLSEGWQVIAVKLAGDGSRSLGGVLPPLRVSFDAPDPVYPMRLSALAATPQRLSLYVLADHKTTASSPAPADGELTMVFAGPNDQATYPAVPAVNGEPAFVTRYDGQWSTPADITSDISFAKAADDAAYREVITEEHHVHHEAARSGNGGRTADDDSGLSTPLAVGLGVIAFIAAIAVASGVVMLTRRRRG